MVLGEGQPAPFPLARRSGGALVAPPTASEAEAGPINDFSVFCGLLQTSYYATLLR